MVDKIREVRFKNRKELESNRKNWRELGYGAFGTCYLTPDNEVFKIYNFDIACADKTVDDFDQIIGLENDTYVFPNGLIFVQGKLYGYTMRYIPGENLDKSFADISFNLLPVFIKKVEIDTRKISDMTIKNNDIKFSNTMSNKDGFSFIDTEDYCGCRWEHSDNIYKRNIKNINQMFIKESVINYPEVNGIVKGDTLAQEIIRTMKADNTVLLAELFLRLQYLAADIIGKKIDTIGDFSKLEGKVKVR